MIEYLAETGSTSADLAARLRGGDFVPEGHWLVADRQTAGKGRQGRDWFDGAGNFMGSTVVHQRFGDPDLSSLALVVGLAVREAVETRLPIGEQVRLKWPNDLMIGTAKLAGILLERMADSVIIGVGVNLASAPELPDRETVALNAPDRDAFAADLARQFDIELDRWRSFGFAPIVQRWLAAAHPLGTPLSVGEPGEIPLTGTFAGISEDGTLLLRLASGETRVIHAGDVRLISDS
ncbi:biotin--[acetyl-CoA-carboxylase] ligase [Novosphingobium sp. G106]|uniref:biotin--[acetyl-CoA-carboxylase] ligase n=1 Tax=Novosphingobium sp. G106 TaxID=2849500 RepID=UPI001C2CF09F|nr:biotin--[acetyl-CoA-carboxylase] ligase [Novosphingobium sp. G106]MBV1687095.1 biotin--[acetyl-CoA-carboxylase] ligase [Novosphingobium sp. G106]